MAAIPNDIFATDSGNCVLTRRPEWEIGGKVVTECLPTNHRHSLSACWQTTHT